MHRAIFQISHHSEYAKATHELECSITMWCGRHADLIFINGPEAEESLAEIADSVGIAEKIQQGGEIVGVTTQCLLSHQDDLLETHLIQCNCLTFDPVTYENGYMITRVISLERQNLSVFHDSIQNDYEVNLRSIEEIDEAERYPSFIFGVDLPEFSHRQYEALATAYEMGYYKIPRDTTTEEIADSLDISRRTFENHLRLAEEKAVESLILFTTF